MLPNVLDKDLLKKSVTSGDMTSYVRDGVVNFLVPFAGWGIDQLELPPKLPPYWSYARDDILRATIHREGFWAAAVGIAITKVAAKGFEVIGEGDKRRERARDLVLYADGRQVGWVNFISKHIRDYLLTDNGAFVEIIRYSKGYGSRIIGIRHLDSRRCQRTGDPEIPVLYRDRRGALHELKFHQVMDFSEMPDPGETYFGVGHCAASRAYSQVYKTAGLEWYMNEKVRGMRPLAIHIVNGLLQKQLDGAITSAKTQAISNGVSSYMGAVLVGIPAQHSPSLVTIPLAELPDGFNRKEEFDIAALTYANALGMDPQELQPLTGGNLGTGSQSQVLHDKSKGRGLVSWSSDWTHKMNEWVMPDKITFAFTEDDLDDASKKAAGQAARAGVAQARISAGLTNADQERQILADAGDIPKEFLDEDVTPIGSLDDDEKEPDDKTGGPAAEKPEAAEEKPAAAELKPGEKRPGAQPDKAGTSRPKPSATSNTTAKETGGAGLNALMIAMANARRIVRRLRGE